MNTCHTTADLGIYTLIQNLADYNAKAYDVATANSLTIEEDETPASFPVLGVFGVGADDTLLFDEVPASLCLDLIIARYGTAIRTMMDDLADKLG